jgi:hypothetical protein
MVLRRVFGTTERNKKYGQRKLHNKDLDNFHDPPTLIEAIK